MEDTPAPRQYASSPFDHAQADIILRSSDNVDFCVFKLFLSLASSFFETAFSLPQPTSQVEEVEDGLPIVPVAEDSKTLDAFLRFCYPCTLAEDPVLTDFRDILNVLEASKKYTLDAIEKAILKTLFQPSVLEKDSLRCFAIACRAHLPDEGRLAARYSLREPLIPEWFEEIKLLTSTDLLMLLRYHQECAKEVQILRWDLSWIKQKYPEWTVIPWMFGRSCGCPKSTTGTYMPLGRAPVLWWENFMNQAFTSLSDKPFPDTVREEVEKAISWHDHHSCQYCAPLIPAGMREFGTLFADKVDELLSTVQLALEFW